MDLCYSICGQTCLQLGICIVSVLEKGSFVKNSVENVHGSRRALPNGC